MKKIKLFSCYSGYGGAEFALKKADIPHECVGFSEIHKGQIKIYEQNHPGVKNYGDITKIDIEELPDFDLITGGFPCQDVSIAGLRDLSKGRTNTVFQMLDIIRIKKPKYCLLENVEGILSMLNGELLNEIIRQLKNMGYAVSYKLLFSKDHGTPQNRPRVWIACELGRNPFMFNPFPKKEELKLFVSDLLEDNVADSYYLNEKQIQRIIERSEIRNKPLGIRLNPKVSTTLTTHPPISTPTQSIYINSNITRTLTAGDYSKQTYSNQFIIHSTQPRSGDPNKGGTGHLSRDDGISYTIDTKNSQCIQLNETYNLERKTLIDTYNHKIISDGISPTLPDLNHNTIKVIENIRLRTLTPKECFRLMGFFNDEINIEGIPKTTAYFSAGNGWDINVVSQIFSKWLK